MKSKLIARVAGLSAGAAMVLSFGSTAGAQTVAELQAQIQLLMQQIAALSGGASAGAAITSDLTVGSTGSQVVALQNALVAQGHLSMPAGVPMGYFGALTKAAVAKWQAANGLPATGYFGPLSRARFNGSVATTPGTTTGGTVGTGTGSGSGVITTPGAEGDIAVTNAPVSNSTVFEGSDRAPLLAFKVEASGSDMALQRVRVDLGTSNTLYRDVLDRIYLVDDGNRVLAAADLNNSTVVRNASDEYEITLTGINSVVSRGSSRVYSIQADVSDQIDSSDLTSYTITLSENGVRAVDGAGIDAFDPTNDTDVTKTITFSGSLAESASLIVSTGATPGPREVIAAAGAQENEADKVVLLVFDIRAEKDAIKITDLKNFVVTAVGQTAPATASTTYLYAGNGTGGSLLGTATAVLSDVDFNDISFTIPANSSRTFTLAVDVRGAVSSTTLDASLTGNTTNVVGEASNGDIISTVTGSADANAVTARKFGPVFTLLSAPTVTKTAAEFSGATSSAQATFRVRMTAVGSDIIFGGNGSTTFAIADQDNTTVVTGIPVGPSSVIAYLNGAVTHPAVASSTSLTIPSSGLTNLGSNSYRLSEGNSVDLTVDFVFPAKLSSGVDVSSGAYSFELQRLNWISTVGAPDSSTFMASSTDWRTSSVTLP
jgi:peptidoglycan hydrolase-like protein with peptidoglycan-binding domain